MILMSNKESLFKSSFSQIALLISEDSENPVRHSALNFYLSNIIYVVFPDGLSSQTLKGHICLRFQNYFCHTSCCCWERSLTSGVYGVNMSSVLQQSHHNCMKGQKVWDNLLVGDDDMEWSVFCSVNSLINKFLIDSSFCPFLACDIENKTF